MQSLGTPIVINGRAESILASKLSYSDLAHLAYGDKAVGKNVTVTYSAREGNEGGTINKHGTVKIVKNMVFNVGMTSNA